MVARIHYRWDFIGLSTDNKPTPETSEKVVDGSTYYCSDNSKLYVWYKTQWYERKPLGGGGGGGSYTAGNGIDITDDTISVDTTTIQAKLTAGDNITITDDTISATDTTYTAGSNITITNGEISATDTTYSAFTGTDGTAAGTAGLVPAPATTDAGKFLKADGTWDTAGGGSGPTVVQTTGTSTTDVMSQNAVTSMVFADPDTQYKIKIGAGTSTSEGSDGIEIGHLAYADAENSVSLGRNAGSSTTAIGGVAIGSNTYASGVGTIALGATSGGNNLPQGVMTIGPSNTYYGYNSTNYRLLTGLYDGQSAHDAATKGQLDSIAIQNAGAPTTATVGTVGQLLEDTTNGKLYICTDTTGGSYTWTEVGAGGGGSGITELTSADYNWPENNPDGIAFWKLNDGIYHMLSSVKFYHDSTGNYDTERLIVVTTETVYKNCTDIVPHNIYYRRVNQSGTIVLGYPQRVLTTDFIKQSPGTSQTDVMSQNAVTSMIFADPETQQKIKIGAGTSSSEGNNGIEIGHNAAATGNSSVALGNTASASKLNAIAIGKNSLAKGQESIAIGDGADTGNDITNSVALGSGAQCHYKGEVNIGSENSYQAGYNSSNYRLLTGVYDPQSAHDAATKGYVDPTTDSSAPTTATVGRLGQIFIDTTNAAAYMCVAVDTVTPSYTWKQITV